MSYLMPVFPVLVFATLAGSFFNVPKARHRSFLLLSATLLFLYCWPPIACVALRPLESRYSMLPPQAQEAQAIVVLSSAVFPAFPPRPTAVLGNDTYERCAYAAWLYTHWQKLPVLASGGGSHPGLAYSHTMREALQQAGVPASSIWTEDHSTSTYENATFSAAILRAKGIHRIVLVTEAYHMPRAELCFRKQGFDVIPAACGFRAVWNPHQTEEWLPAWEAIAWNNDTLHEAFGLVYYRLRGRI